MKHKKAKLLKRLVRGGADDVVAFDSKKAGNRGADFLDSIYGPEYEAACERSRQVLLGELVAGKKTVEQFDEELDVIFNSLKFDAKARSIVFCEYTGKELKLHALMW
jgi:hypothetical protein